MIVNKQFLESEKNDDCQFPYIICYVAGRLKSLDQAFSNAILLEGVEGLVPLGRPHKTMRWVQGLLFIKGKGLPGEYLIGKGLGEPGKFLTESKTVLLFPRELLNTMVNYQRMPLPNTTASSRSITLLTEIIVSTIISEVYYGRLEDATKDSPQNLVQNFIENGISGLNSEQMTEVLDGIIPNFYSASWSILRLENYQKQINEFMATQVDVEVGWNPLIGNVYISSKNSTDNIDSTFKFPFDDQIQIDQFLKELKEDFDEQIEHKFNQAKSTATPISKQTIGKQTISKQNKVITKKTLRNPDRFRRTINPEKSDNFSIIFNCFRKVHEFFKNWMFIKFDRDFFELNETFQFENSKQFFSLGLIVVNISKIFIFFIKYLLPIVKFEELKKLFEIWSKINYYKINVEKIYIIGLGFTDSDFNSSKSGMFAAYIVNRINWFIIERTVQFTNLSLVMQKLLFTILENEYRQIRIRKPLFYLDNGTITQNLVYIWEQEVKEILIYLKLVDSKILKLNEKIISRIQTLFCYFPNLRQHYILTKVFDDRTLSLFMKNTLTSKEIAQIISSHHVGIFSNFQDYKLKTILKKEFLNKTLEKIVNNLVLGFGIYAVYNLLIINYNPIFISGQNGLAVRSERNLLIRVCEIVIDSEYSTMVGNLKDNFLTSPLSISEIRSFVEVKVYSKIIDSIQTESIQEVISKRKILKIIKMKLRI